jgi:hypothetical protein
MSDRDSTLNIESDRTLASALRALPTAAPMPDLWSDLARALVRKPRPRRWRYMLPAAIAASVALALLVPRVRVEQHAVPSHAVPSPLVVATPSSSATVIPLATPSGDDTELDSLHHRSQSLERWIAAVAAHAPQDSRDLMAAVEVEDLIGLVDMQLGATQGDADALPLWRRRVALLQDLATIRGNAFTVAANDDGAARSSSHLLN